MEGRQLTVRRDLTPDAWSMISSVAPAMAKSGLFGVRTSEQAMAIMLKGFELGLGLSSSFEFIHVIQGKPVLSPKGMLALIQDHSEFDGMKVEDLVDEKGEPAGCKVWMKRKNGVEYTATFTKADAKRAGLLDKDVWQKYEANMYRWRAIGFCADIVYPDVIGGMKRADEMDAGVTHEGEIVDVTPSESTWPGPAPVGGPVNPDNDGPDPTGKHDEPGKEIPGEPDTNKAHWIDREGVKERFFGWLNRENVAKETAYDWLGCGDTIRNYNGTMAQAKEIIEHRLAERKAQEAAAQVPGAALTDADKAQERGEPPPEYPGGIVPF